MQLSTPWSFNSVPMPDPAIRLCDVSRTYGEQVAVWGVTLRFQPGTTTCLIGPSGCGKSTLLRLIIGLVSPDRGNVFINEEILSGENLLPFRRQMGYVIQDGGLFPHLTAVENVVIMARQVRMPHNRVSERVDDLCDLTKFPRDRLDRYPAELSGGQRQRVSLMRALMLRPDVLLLDEPLGALDPMVRAQLQTDLKQIVSRLGQTVVMVTHDLAEAAFLADRIVLMNEGVVVQQGTYAELRDTPVTPFVTDFIRAQRSLVDL